jgi:hypothetical protein
MSLVDLEKTKTKETHHKQSISEEFFANGHEVEQEQPN